MNILTFITAVLVLTGAGSPEELEEYEIERFERYHQHPLNLNAASRSRLLSSGLFTAYQTASLLDYRAENGDILSFTELSLVNGFSKEAADALSYFVILESRNFPGAVVNRSPRVQYMARTSARDNGSTGFAAGTKLMLELGDMAEAYWGSRTTYGSKELSPGTASIAVYGRRRLGKLVLGDFNARFGQGLAAWSGFSMSGFPSASSFVRSGSGISPSHSYSRTLHGIAADFDIGRFNLSGAWSYPDGILMNLSWTGMKTKLGTTLAGNTASADWQLAIGNASFFGEMALLFAPQDGQMTAAVAAGLSAAPSYGRSAAILLRYMPAGYKPAFGGQARSSSRKGDEHGVAAAWQTGSLTTSFDASFRPSAMAVQYKMLLQYSPELKTGPSSVLTPSIRIGERYRPDDTYPLRNDLRFDLAFRHKDLGINGRLNFVSCRERAWLGYGEIGWKHSWLRATAFNIDRWDDRIYVYERDAPGGFSAPAYYRRGMNMSVLLSIRKEKRHALYARTSFTFWSKSLAEPPPSRAEALIQYNLSIFPSRARGRGQQTG